VARLLGRRCIAVAVLALGAAAAPAAAITPTVTEYTGGVAPGFSVNAAPEGITTGPDGNLWFTENGPPGRVARITTSGVVTEFSNGVSANDEPFGITNGPDGNLWMTEAGGPGHVASVTTTGVVTELTGGVTPGFSAMGRPYAAATASNGRLWFTESGPPGRIAQILPGVGVNEHTGGLTPGFSAGAQPSAIVAGPDGNLWVTEFANPGRIARVSTSAAVTEFAGGATPGFTANAGPNFIAVGPDGNLWFTEYLADALARITTAGAVTEFRTGISPNADPEQIVTGPDGALWFTEFGDPGRIGRITTSGAITEFTSGTTPGFSLISFSAEGITLGPDGNIWFVETANPGRIARITTPPAATTGDASARGATSVTLAATVNGHAQPTSVQFEISAVAHPETVTTTSAQNIGSNAADTPVTTDVGDLVPGTAYRYRVVATNPTDTTTGGLRTFTMTAAGAAKAAITRLEVTPRSLRAAAKGPTIAATGATISYRDSQPARTAFTVLRPKRGVKRAGKCAAPKRGQRIAKAKRCTRYVSVGRFSHADRAGTNRLRFSGRMHGHKLAPGAYRLTARPTFDGLIGTPATTSFKVLAPQRGSGSRASG
jgi:streptogramin lyase